MKEEKPQTTQVVALQYEGQGAPRVTAKGRDEIAEKILEIAKAHDIPLYQSPELTALLAKVALGDEIPEKLYQAVAKVLYFVYMLNDRNIPGQDPNPNRP